MQAHIVHTLDPANFTHQDYVDISNQSSVTFTYNKPRPSRILTGQDATSIARAQQRVLPPNTTRRFLYAHVHPQGPPSLLSAMIKPSQPNPLGSGVEEIPQNSSSEEQYTLSFAHTTPSSTAGFLYLRPPPRKAPATAWTIRFRVTDRSDPRSFNGGSDYVVPSTGLPWELSLAQNESLLRHGMFTYLFNKDRLVEPDVLRRCLNLSMSLATESDADVVRWENESAANKPEIFRVPQGVQPPLIYSFGQPFCIDFSRTTHKLHILSANPDRIRPFYLDMPTVATWSRSEGTAYQPLYKGMATACFDKLSNGKIVVRLLRLLEPVVPNQSSGYLGKLPFVLAGDTLLSTSVLRYDRDNMPVELQVDKWSARIRHPDSADDTEQGYGLKAGDSSMDDERADERDVLGSLQYVTEHMLNFRRLQHSRRLR